MAKASTNDTPGKVGKVKKTRSRFGCHNCKRLKVKCDETKPACLLCVKSNKKCDYSIQLTWGGRPYKNKKVNDFGFATINSFAKEQSPNATSSSTVKPPSPDTPLSFTAETPGNSFQIVNERENDSFPAKKKQRIDETFQSPLGTPMVGPSTSMHEVIDTPLEFFNSDPLLPDISNITRENMNLPDSHDPTAFKDMETTNVAAKEFLNEWILPDLQIFEEEDFSYTSGLNPRIKALEDDPESLLDEESLMTRNAFSNISSLTTTTSMKPPTHLSYKEQEEEALELLTGYEFIPFGFAPLPDMLLKVPYFRENYYSFVEVVSVVIVPAPPSAYQENPVRCIIPRMALSSNTDGMLSLLIATGIVQNSLFRGEERPRGIVNMLLKKALNDLYNRLTDDREAESDYTLALIMMLACFESIFGERHDWRSHHYGSRKIILSRGLLKISQDLKDSKRKLVKFAVGEETDIIFFLARWFAYTDIIGSLSSSFRFDGAYADNDKRLVWESPNITSEDVHSLKDIDPLLGFDLRLMEHFAAIVTLAKEREGHVDPDSDIEAIPLVERALMIKDKLYSGLENGEREREVITPQVILREDPKLLQRLEGYDVLRATNKVFVLAGVLQIYRRILLMPRTDPLVQNLVVQIAQILRAKISIDAPAAFCTIFSLFTAGCDAVDDQTKYFYKERLLALGRQGYIFGYEAYSVMEECWNTGRYWADLITERDIDFSFF